MEGKKVKDFVRKMEDSGFIDNEYELTATAIKVFQEDETLCPDFILSTKSQAFTEWVTESVVNSSLAYTLLLRYATDPSTPKWSVKKSDWDRNEDGSVRYYSLVEINTKEAKTCIENALYIKSLLMKKQKATSLMQRNDPNNVILMKGLFRDKTEENRPAAYTEQDKGLMERLKDKFGTGNEEVEYD
jgi:hypothetical protein